MSLLFLSLPIHNLPFLYDEVIREEQNREKKPPLVNKRKHQPPFKNKGKKKKEDDNIKNSLSKNRSNLTKIREKETSSLIRSTSDREHNITIMLYLNGDNWREYFHQEEIFIKEFLDAARVGSNENITIVCQLDRYRGGNESFGNWTNTRRFIIKKGMKPTPANTLENLGEKNMGSPEVLKNFIFWTFDHYPAEKYLLAGLVRNNEVYSDQNAVYVDKDWLGVKEFTNALRTVRDNSGEKIDIFLPYVLGIGSTFPFYCTATLYGLKNISKAIVLPNQAYDSSQTYFLEDILRYVKDKTAFTSTEIAKIIAEIQYNQSDGRRSISVFNVTAYSDSLLFLNQLSKLMLRNDYYPNDTKLQKAFEDSSACLGSDDTYDLLNLSQEIQIHKSNNSLVHNLSEQLEKSLKNARIYFNKDSGEIPIPLEISGIFIQLDSQENLFLGSDWKTIHSMQFGKKSFWDEFWKVKKNKTIPWVHETTLSKTSTLQSINVSFNIDTNIDKNLTLSLYGVSDRGELLLRKENLSIAGNNFNGGTRGNWTVNSLCFPYSGNWALKLGVYGKKTLEMYNMMYPGVNNQSRKLRNIEYNNGNLPEVKIKSPDKKELITTNKLEIDFQVNSSTDYLVFSRLNKKEWVFQGSRISKLFVNISNLWDWTSYNHTFHFVQLKIKNDYGSIKSLQLPIKVNNNEDTILVIANGKVRDYIPEGLKELGLGENYNLTKTYNETHSKLPCFSPSASEMSDFETVFWLEGRNNYLNLTRYQQENIEQYLSNYSGNIAISGENLAQACNSSYPNFLHRYLKTAYMCETVDNATLTNDKAVFHSLTSSKKWGEYIKPKGDAKKTIIINGSEYGGGIQYCKEYKMLFTTTLPKNTGFNEINYVNRSIQFLNTSKPSISIQKPYYQISYSNSTQAKLEGEVIDWDYMGTKLYINESFIDTLNNPWNINYSFPTEGKYLLTFESWDRIRHYTKKKIFVIVDLTKPNLTIISPFNRENISSHRVNLTWESSDKYFETSSYRENSSWKNTSTMWHEFTDLEEGKQTFYLRTYDKAGNKKRKNVTVTIDTNEPHFYWITAENSVFNQSEVSIKWNTTDIETNLCYQMYQLNKKSWYNTSTINVTFSNLSEQMYTFRIQVYDWAGNVYNSSLTFWVDMAYPNISIATPNDGNAYSHNEITISWYANDSSGVFNLTYTIDNGKWHTINTTETFMNITVPDGTYILGLKIIDWVGKSEKDNATFIVDTMHPSINLFNQNHTFYNTKNVTIEWNCTDNGTGVNFTKVRIGSRSWEELPTFGNSTFTLTEGNHTLTFLSKDLVGNSLKTKLYLKVDLTSPSLVITYPELEINPFWCKEDIHIRYKAKDSSFHCTKLYRNDSLASTYHKEGLIETSEEWEEGTYKVWLEAVDKAGNTNKSRTIFIKLDKTRPEIETTVPHYSSSSSFRVNWNYSDNFDLKICQIKKDNISWMNVSSTGNYTFPLKEGNHTIFFKVVDMVDHEALSLRNVTIDFTSPNLSIIDPLYGEWFRSSRLKIRWKGSDKYLYHYKLKVTTEGIWTDIGKRTEKRISGLSTGSHKIYVKAVDKAGNTKKDAVSVNIDLEKPQIQIKKPDSAVKLQHFNLSWSSIDDMGIKKTRLFLNNTLIQTYYNTSIERHEFKNVQQGIWNVTLKVSDYVNHTAWDHIQVEIRNMSISILTSKDQYYTAEREVLIRWKAEGRGLTRVEIYLEKEKQAVLSWKTLNYTLKLGKNASDGDYHLKVRLSDRYGNSVNDQIVITLDTKEPTVILTSPSNSTFTNSTINFTWKGRDIYSTEVYVNRTRVTRTPYLYYKRNFTTGKHKIKLRAIDHAGNSQNSSVIVVYGDKNIPNINLLKPTSTKLEISKDLNITWRITENYPFINVSVIIDGNVCYVSNDFFGSFSFSNLRIGKHFLKVKAVDRAGNYNFTSLTILIFKSNEKYWSLHNFILNFVVIFLISIGLTLTIKGIRKILKVK